MTKVMTFRRCDKVNLPERQREGGLGYGRQVLPDRSWFYVFSAAGDAEHRPSVRAPERRMPALRWAVTAIRLPSHISGAWIQWDAPECRRAVRPPECREIQNIVQDVDKGGVPDV